MITLIEAYRLCNIKEEAVLLQAANDTRQDHFWFWSKRVPELFDMRKVKVIRIEPCWERYGPDYLGMLFVVRGIDAETLRELEHKGMWR